MGLATIIRLEKASIMEVIRREPAFSELFITHLLERAVRVEADLVDQLFNSSEKRLAKVLCFFGGISAFHEQVQEAGVP